MGKPTILTLNAGSSSLKFAVFEAARDGARLMHGAVERIGLDGTQLRLSDAHGAPIDALSGPIADYADAMNAVLCSLDRLGDRLTLTAVGHRVAHGGPDCDCPEQVTPAVMTQLRGLIHLAPLHLPANLAGIDAMTMARPDLPQIACYDTAFHHGLPPLAQMTGLPRAYQSSDLRRYGYHGLSYEYILAELRANGVDVVRERILIAHLGNGASACAIKGGKSVETTMGFSTVAGLPMGTRSGDLDPGLLLYLMTEKGLTAKELEQMLYTGSGLKGLSGISRNMVDLLASQDPAAAEAIGYFCYPIRRHLVGLTAAMGGLDRLIFTGGIGANAPLIRAGICDGLDYLGLALDPDANAAGIGRISGANARVTVEARETDEEAMIARHVRGLTPCCATADVEMAK